MGFRDVFRLVSRSAGARGLKRVVDRSILSGFSRAPQERVD